MSEEELTYMDFVKEAFNARPKLKLIGGLPLNWMGMAGFGVLGILNPGFWLVGAGLEVGYLLAMSHSPRFRNYVRGRRIQEAKKARARNWRERQEVILQNLGEASQARFRAFVNRIENAKADRGEEELVGLIGDVADDGLHMLRWIHLKLLASQETLQRQVDPGVRQDLKSELDEFVRRVEALGMQGDSRIRHSLESTIEILRQRLKNLDDAQDNLTYIDSELRRIEHQAELIIEEAALATDADQLSSRIDAVTSTFNETQEWMRLNKELLLEFDTGDDDPGRPPPNRVMAG
ncbi:MAG: hypothetical protein JRJ84_11160 [Deltaproteobacteria bacterium]|nr:hypothetical protein [Deltaproteobacteria bacterium]